jgi:hypothetical protein
VLASELVRIICGGRTCKNFSLTALVGAVSAATMIEVAAELGWWWGSGTWTEEGLIVGQGQPQPVGHVLPVLGDWSDPSFGPELVPLTSVSMSMSMSMIAEELFRLCGEGGALPNQSFAHDEQTTCEHSKHGTISPTIDFQQMLQQILVDGLRTAVRHRGFRQL